MAGVKGVNPPKITRKADPHGPRPVPMKEGQPSRPTPKPSIRPITKKPT